MKPYQTWAAAVATAILALAASPSLAQNQHAHGANDAAPAISPQEHAFGQQGNPTQVWRTLTVEMTDSMRFKPAEISIQQGETVRFIVRNAGALKHEMVLGTLASLKEHGQMMGQQTGMSHDAPYMVHVDPGQSQELIWHFTKAGQFQFGCLVAGHFEAGMAGKITVNKR